MHICFFFLVFLSVFVTEPVFVACLVVIGGPADSMDAQWSPWSTLLHHGADDRRLKHRDTEVDRTIDHIVFFSTDRTGELSDQHHIVGGRPRGHYSAGSSMRCFCTKTPLVRSITYLCSECKHFPKCGGSLPIWRKEQTLEELALCLVVRSLRRSVWLAKTEKGHRVADGGCARGPKDPSCISSMNVVSVPRGGNEFAGSRRKAHLSSASGEARRGNAEEWRSLVRVRFSVLESDAAESGDKKCREKIRRETYSECSGRVTRSSF